MLAAADERSDRGTLAFVHEYQHTRRTGQSDTHYMTGTDNGILNGPNASLDSATSGRKASYSTSSMGGGTTRSAG